MDDLGRVTYDGMKQKLSQAESQLAEAVQIIRELTDVVQSVRASGCWALWRPAWATLRVQLFTANMLCDWAPLN